MNDHQDLVIRDAALGDVPAIIALLVDDKLGSTRETPGDLAPYRAAFHAIDADPNQRLIVAERDGQVVATLQFTVIPGLSQRGLTRAQVEAVRVAKSERGNGLGTVLMRWSIDEARRRGCGLVQLTSNQARPDAHRFYERLGFAKTHAGFKLKLDSAD